jgi:hypothetical protein
MAAFHDLCPESRHSVIGHDRLYGFAPTPATSADPAVPGKRTPMVPSGWS